MPSSPNPFYLLSHSLCFFGFISQSIATTPHYYNNLVYNHCKNQTLNDPRGALSQTLYHELVDESSKSKFFETIVGDERTAISGLFQCREDLSNGDCHACVSEIPKMSNSLCGDTIPTRVQLSGCYIHYEADELSESTNLGLLDPLHKNCSESKAAFGEFFEGVMNGAFAEVESSLMSGARFCDISYESMKVVAQCEGNLGICDCVECVSSAVHVVEDECGDSLSGEVYMQSCFIGYTYYPNGIPSISNGDQTGSGNIPTKLIAIVAGGLAALAIGVALVYSTKSFRKKREDW